MFADEGAEQRTYQFSNWQPLALADSEIVAHFLGVSPHYYVLRRCFGYDGCASGDSFDCHDNFVWGHCTVWDSIHHDRDN
jgi:hypothetical protein